MFKKLKKKIEEGEEVGTGGLEKLAFSPRKLPGSVVRSSPADGESGPFPPPSEGQEENAALSVSRGGEGEGPERSSHGDDVQGEDRGPETPVRVE